MLHRHHVSASPRSGIIARLRDETQAEHDAIELALDWQVRAGSRPARLIVVAGRPLREPVMRHGPFVMNTRAELMQAFEDYQAGRLGSIPAAHAHIDASTPDA